MLPGTKFHCTKHHELYNSYCRNCKEELCLCCEKNHNTHEIIYFGQIMPEESEINNKIQILKDYIDQFNDIIQNLIIKLNTIKINIEEYYKTNLEIINLYKSKKRNYVIISIINEAINNFVIKDLYNITTDKNINEKNICQKFNSIIEIDNKMKSILRERYREILKTVCFKSNERILPTLDPFRAYTSPEYLEILKDYLEPPCIFKEIRFKLSKK